MFRQKITRPVPAGAEIVTKGGTRVARWRVRGKIRTAPLTTGEDGTDRLLTEARTYTAKFRDHTGNTVTRPTGCRDEQAARQLLAGWEREAEQIKAGTLDAKALDTARKAPPRSTTTWPRTSGRWSRPGCLTCTGRTSSGRSGRWPQRAGSPPQGR